MKTKDTKNAVEPILTHFLQSYLFFLLFFFHEKKFNSVPKMLKYIFHIFVVHGDT